MNRKLLFTILLTAITFGAFAQKATTVSSNTIARPKLVVGIVIDQMRWDYLYRFYNAYAANGGFKRLLNSGFSCDNTFVPYLPTVTAAGHTCVYTGSVPALHGIVGNDWYDSKTGKAVYCADDNSVQTVGSDNAAAGKMSPKNLWATTITDELRLATNFQSKVIGISAKDRGAIFPAGHSANAAYWFDGKSGNFVTSTYYTNQLPQWLQNFNAKNLPDTYLNNTWNTLLDKTVYEKYCDTDDNSYESDGILGTASFPHDLQKFKGKDKGKLIGTPFGNNLLEELAKTVVAEERMGKHDVTDFLAVSFSSTDYVGHAYGPNSWELMDTYLRLDQSLGDFFDYLDKTVGKNQYTVFLTADHAGAHVPEFLNKHHIPGGRLSDGEVRKDLQAFTQQQFGTKLISAVEEYDIYLNHSAIDSLKLNEDNVTKAIIEHLLNNDNIVNAFVTKNAGNIALPAKVKEMVINGYSALRSGDIRFLTKTGVMDAGKQGMSHGVWNNYDAHIPLLWYGWGIKQGRSVHETYMTDIAATVAALLHIQMPSACIGKVIEEVVK